MGDHLLKNVIRRSEVLLDRADDPARDTFSEARALQNCLRYLLRDASELRLDMTSRLLAAAIEAVDTELQSRQN
ncbi:hypothetical protein ACFQPI_10695 [Insolitispirillum peregrinum]|uniref:hypothetical protein n=1 Tax=Insolitispirillum peregrinum TaxID=80876 RepID=UPI0036081723